MTKSTTDIPILDDDAITEMETRSKTGHYPSLENVAALCATVRALRVEMKTQKTELLQLSGRGELLTKVHVNFDDLDPLEAARNEFDRLRNVVIRDLQSQLEQVTKERNALLEAMNVALPATEQLK